MTPMSMTSTPDPLTPRPFRIHHVSHETSDVFTFELSPANGGPSLGFQSGQFNMIYLHGVGEVPISVSGDPEQPGRIIHTIRAVGSVTREMQKLKPGDLLGLRGPYGTSWPVRQAEGHDVVLVAGGIGLAPLRPVIYEILARRNDFGKLYILYGARTPADLVFAEELAEWRSRFDVGVRIIVDRATAEWKGSVGVVPRLIREITVRPEQTMAMICGPEIMMRFTVQELKALGVPENKIYVSMERNMKCAVGFCGHCQFGPEFVCKDGPVFVYPRVAGRLAIREL